MVSELLSGGCEIDIVSTRNGGSPSSGLRRGVIMAAQVLSPIAILCALLVSAGCRGSSIGATHVHDRSPRVANLHAFARLYGVVRWFHPSDAAAAFDWDRFAIEGAHRVVDVPDVAGLRRALAELVAPIAPTVHITATGEAFPDEPALRPATGENLEVVAWEHLGYGDSSVTDVYGSKRRHRPRTVPVAGFPYGALWQAVDATPYRGALVRLRGRMRTSSSSRGQLWLRIERDGTALFSDSMADRAVVSPTWESAEVSGPVALDATRIVFGPRMSGGGAVWYDDLELAVQGRDGRWAPIEIQDPGFEATDPLTSWKPGLGSPRALTIEGWKVSPDHDRVGAGATSLRIEAATRVVTDELFADAPQPGETVDVDLGGGLRARVPIALYSRNGHTIGDDPAAAREAQRSPTASSPGFDAVAGAADVIVAWNALEHFWPYWNLFDIDWIAELDVALRDALGDRTVDDHLRTLRRLSAAAPDAHASVGCPGATRRAKLPFKVDVIEDQVVVTATADAAILRGDVIVSVDGRAAVEQFAEEEALASGSPQFRRVRARGWFGSGPSGSGVVVRVRRAGTELNVSVQRGDHALEDSRRAAIERLDDGVYYVDLSRASMPEIDKVMDKLATAPGVVFDVRDRPNGNQQLLSHLFTHPDDSKWLAIPHVIRPDHVRSSITGWDPSGWDLPVLQPHIAGRVAFLTGPLAVSYAESVMGFVEHNHLGEIVGSATAGTNGDVAQIAEPTGCFSMFSGLRVTKHDGSRFHLIGVQPTIPATRTIAGVAAGRDEVLERALAYIRETPRR